MSLQGIDSEAVKANRAALTSVLASLLLTQVAVAGVRPESRNSAIAVDNHGVMAYTHPCTSGIQRSYSFVVRGSYFGFDGSDHTGAIGDARVRTQGPCTNSTGTNYDIPFVLPANLQSSSSSSRIVQVGYARCGKPAGQLCTGVPTGAQKFIYICNDNSMGAICDATSWAGDPILGRRYRFRVQYNQLGTGKWDYSIQDLVTGITKFKSITSTWHNADGVWWGGENTDEGSVMASAHVGGNDIEMYWMQYFRSSVGAWNVVTDISSTSSPRDYVQCQISGSGCVIGGEPSWYGFTIFSQNFTNDGIQIWSSDHP